eukprot:5327941-Amphidinium_carterae.1
MRWSFTPQNECPHCKLMDCFVHFNCDLDILLVKEEIMNEFVLGLKINNKGIGEMMSGLHNMFAVHLVR